MSGLSKATFDHTQRYIDAVRGDLSSMGIDLGMSGDMHEWKRVLAQSEGIDGLSKPFDPDLNDIRSSDAFWISLSVGGKVIACGGGRVFVCDDFIREYLTTYLLFGNASPLTESMPYEFVHEGPRLSGRVGYGGGVWVHPAYGGKGLAKIVSHMGKVIAFRHLRVDFYTALIKHRREQWASKELGWNHGCFLTTGHYLGKDDSECAMDFFWMTHREIVGLISERIPASYPPQPLTTGNTAAVSHG